MPVNRIVYNEKQDVFFDDVLHNRVADKMLIGAEALNFKPNYSELASWRNNAPKIKNLLELANVKNTYVTFEYFLPYKRERIDCMIYGRGANNQGNVIHLELKQWTNDGVTSAPSEGNFDVIENGNSDQNVKYNVNAITGGGVRTVPHPSQQVKGYNNYLNGFVEVLSEGELNLTGAAYCYNYKRNTDSNTALYDSQYSKLLAKYRTYAGDEVEDLSHLLKEILGNGDGLSVFNKMINSSIHPSKKILDSAAKLIHEGKTEAFSLIDEQIVARNIILDKINKLQKNSRKSVIIVKGGPGTGKTVIALHLLALIAGMKERALNVHFATKSKPLLEGVKFQLPKKSEAKLLFHNVTQYVPANCDENEIDVLMIDEAHRMTKSSNNRFQPQNNTHLLQVETLIRASKITVFFIDDKQAIRGIEIGSSELIREYAKKYNAKIEEVQLKSQFRCNGSDNYLDWVEQLLYNQRASAFFEKEEFDFKIFDTPKDLYAAILEKNSLPQTTARLCAGFCWPWSNQLDSNGNLIKDVKIGSFAMPWETHGDIKKPPKGFVKWYEWAYKSEGIKQVGCIYTAQGFEFDYIGVIVGKDLIYNNYTGLIETDIKASEDPVLKRSGPKVDEYIRNIYRVLMSRGMKGCYVYFCDKPLRHYVEQRLKSSKPEILMAAEKKVIYKA